MIKVTGDIASLIGALLMVFCFSCYIWQFFRSVRKDKKREAYWEAQHKKMEDDHRQFLARMSGMPDGPTRTPPEN